MEDRRPPEYTLDLFADRACVKAVVRAILHTIFFHRYFTPLTPSTHDLLDTTLPYVSDNELETLIDARVTSLAAALESTSHPSTSSGGRGQILLQFSERKRRKNWYGGKADEDLVWERWILDVTLASPRSESEAAKARRAMESSLQRNAIKIVNIVNRDRDHIPPITTNEINPFPYTIVVNPRNEGWGGRIGGIF